MIELQDFKLLGITLSIGLLIGLERGWHSREKSDGTRIAGLRTYGLTALLGGLWGIISQQFGMLLLGFAFLSLTLIVLIAYSKRLDKFEDYSITSLMALLITFTLGALSIFGQSTLASATAVIITLLLGFKPLLHSWINKLEQHELNATLKLLLISVVILPILPDKSFDPWDTFNPYRIWWLVVLITGISYLGYFAVRIVGARHGPVLTGIFGGLVSSTAVTFNLARLSKSHPEMQSTLSSGVITACATMFARTLLLASILNAELFWLLLPAFATMSFFCYLMAFVFWKNAQPGQNNQEIKLDNPFQLAMAIKFGAFLVLILFLTKLLKLYYGNIGTYFLATLSGIADVDPITLSMAQISKDGLLAMDVAARAILIAVTVNSVFKGIAAIMIGNRPLGLKVGGTLLSAVVLGLCVF